MRRSFRRVRRRVGRGGKEKLAATPMRKGKSTPLMALVTPIKTGTVGGPICLFASFLLLLVDFLEANRKQTRSTKRSKVGEH
jgi:hypothetical protein